MVSSVPVVGIFRVGAAHGAAHELPPMCSRCDLEMEAGELRAVRRTVVTRSNPSIGPIVILPVWTCSLCGCRQPRLDL